MANKMFEVEKGRAISSEHYGRDFGAGEIVDLSYLNDEQLAALVASGAVKPSTKQTMTPAPKADEATKSEVKNG